MDFFNQLLTQGLLRFLNETFVGGIIMMFPPLFVAVILHEIAHGWVAEKFGDPTARNAGRITLNPLVHIDPVMTIGLPLLLKLSGSPVVFGGAKPVPVNPLFFKNPRRDMVWVALAGPATNFTIAAGCYLLLHAMGLFEVPKSFPVFLFVLPLLWLKFSIVINLILGLFNLFPIPPLDGGRVLVGVLPLPAARLVARLEPYGILIVFLLLYAGLIDSVLGPVLRAILSLLGLLNL